MTTSRLPQRRRLAAYARERGYAVYDTTRRRALCFRIHQHQALVYGSGQGTAPWVVILPSGLWLEGPGWWSGRRFPASPAGLEWALAELRLDHVRVSLTGAASSAGLDGPMLSPAADLALARGVNAARSALEPPVAPGLTAAT